MRKFKLNSFELQVSILCFLVAAFHFWQFFQSDYNINCIVRCAVMFAGSIICLFFNNTVMYTSAFLLSLIILHFDAFNNYSIFFFTYIFIRKFPKWKWLALSIYVVNTMVVCELHDKNASHLLVHFAMCIIYYLLAEHTDGGTTYPAPDLIVLTDDEIKILKQLELEQKPIDDVEGFSRSTVLRRLDNAQQRNRLESHEDLRKLFRLHCMDIK